MEKYCLEQNEIDALLEVVEDDKEKKEVVKDNKDKNIETFISIFEKELKSILEGLTGVNFNIFMKNFETLSKTSNIIAPLVTNTFILENNTKQSSGMILCNLKLAAVLTDMILGGKGIDIDETEDVRDTLAAFKEINSNILGSISTEYSLKYNKKLSFKNSSDDISYKSSGENIDISKYKYLITFVISKDSLIEPFMVCLDSSFDFLLMEPLNNKKVKVLEEKVVFLNKEENVLKNIKKSRKEFIWWLKGFIEGKINLDENDLKLLKQKLEVI